MQPSRPIPGFHLIGFVLTSDSYQVVFGIAQADRRFAMPAAMHLGPHIERLRQMRDAHRAGDPAFVMRAGAHHLAGIEAR